jgi:hypothetical protein
MLMRHRLGAVAAELAQLAAAGGGADDARAAAAQRAHRQVTQLMVAQQAIHEERVGSTFRQISAAQELKLLQTHIARDGETPSSVKAQRTRLEEKLWRWEKRRNELLLAERRNWLAVVAAASAAPLDGRAAVRRHLELAARAGRPYPRGFDQTSPTKRLELGVAGSTWRRRALDELDEAADAASPAYGRRRVVRPASVGESPLLYAAAVEHHRQGKRAAHRRWHPPQAAAG